MWVQGGLPACAVPWGCCEWQPPPAPRADRCHLLAGGHHGLGKALGTVASCWERGQHADNPRNARTRPRAKATLASLPFCAVAVPISQRGS